MVFLTQDISPTLLQQKTYSIAMTYVTAIEVDVLIGREPFLLISFGEIFFFL